MGKHNWIDSRLRLRSCDFVILEAMLQVKPKLSALLVTGEAHIEAFTDNDLTSLQILNKLLEQKYSKPGLFVLTAWGTVRLDRFDKDVTVELLTLNERKELYQKTAASYGLHYWMEPTNSKGFIEGCFEANKLFGKLAYPNIKGVKKVDTIYLNGITLFNKPAHQHRNVESFLCLNNLIDFRFVDLEDEQKQIVENAKNTFFREITVDESTAIATLVFG